MRVLAGAALALMIGGPALADDDQDMIFARELGQIVATADECGYKLDDGKVAAYVSEKVSAMDSNSRAMFQSGGGAQKIRIKKMSTAEKAAVCALQAELARKYGLTP
ncbi:hypothetical protein [Rhizobium sp. MHM7A]|uniref:hypothetical protein n=1 Tax=Rhizobium sp. MHM7A TaxID=2583233 RepID=UPI001106A800|nr:hypothetical protein [Rhizobium sp. MHM7A]TLX12150.1 hypothetical protein FFR93_16415 [Rhizobium sp. MHM7A]